MGHPLSPPGNPRDRWVFSDENDIYIYIYMSVSDQSLGIWNETNISFRRRPRRGFLFACSPFVAQITRVQVPSDDPETLCVFLVLFENPLLLAEHRTSLFAGFHVALQKLTAAVLSLPKEHREWEHLGDLGGLECERLDTGVWCGVWNCGRV